jgi:hypothetical protein
MIQLCPLFSLLKSRCLIAFEYDTCITVLSDSTRCVKGASTAAAADMQGHEQAKYQEKRKKTVKAHLVVHSSVRVKIIINTGLGWKFSQAYAGVLLKIHNFQLGSRKI